VIRHRHAPMPCRKRWNIVNARDARPANEADSGNAILEFVFVAVLCFVPLVYLVVAVETVGESMSGDSGCS
jgi:hypothetical protein